MSAAFAGARYWCRGIRHEPVHILVPIAVVDELDGLKKSKDPHVRWRAGHAGRPGPGNQQPARCGIPRPLDTSALSTGGMISGQIAIEILFDPPGHVRLPISDDEIISRIVAIEPLAGRPVILVTYHTGQATRGRAAGLPVRKLDKLERGICHRSDDQPVKELDPAG